MIIYQICPKCHGQGTVSKPPWIDGDAYTYSDSSTSVGGYICNVCRGAKIIPIPNEESPAEEQYILVKASEYKL